MSNKESNQDQRSNTWGTHLFVASPKFLLMNQLHKILFFWNHGIDMLFFFFLIDKQVY